MIVRVLPRDPKQPGVRLALTLKAIAGFKGESSEDSDPDDAPRPVSLTLSDDARLMPLSLSVPIWFLPLDVTLLRVCAAGDPCKLVVRKRKPPAARTGGSTGSLGFSASGGVWPPPNPKVTPPYG